MIPSVSPHHFTARRFEVWLCAFILGFRTVRWLDLATFGGADPARGHIGFFLGFVNGRQSEIHFLNLILVVAISWATACALEWALEKYKPAESTAKKICVMFGLAIITFPLLKILFLSFHWTFLSLVIGVCYGTVRHRIQLQIRWPLVAAILVVAAYVWIFPGYQAPFNLDFYHEGDQVGLAHDYLRGKIPFKEIFVDQGVGFNIWKSAVAFRLWGESIGAKRFLEAVLLPVPYLALTWLVWVFVQSGWVAAAFPFLYFLIDPLSSDRPDPSYIALGLLALGLRSRASKTSTTLLFASGALGAFQLFYSMEIGAFFVAACAATAALAYVIERESFSKLKWVAAGWITILGLFSAACILRGSWLDFIWNTWIRLSTHGPVEGIPFAAWRLDSTKAILAGFPPFLSSTVIIHYLPLFVQYAAASWLIINFRAITREKVLSGALLLVASILFYLPALAHADNIHVLYGLPLSVVLGIWLMSQILEQSSKSEMRWPTIAAATAGAFAFFYLAQIYALSDRLTSHAFQISTNWAGVRLPAAPTKRNADVVMSAELHALHDAIEKNSEPGDRLVNLTDNAAIFFTADRMNLTRYYLEEILYTDAMQKEVLRAMEQSSSYLVLVPNDLSIHNRKKEPYTDIANYIRGNLKQVWAGESLALWKKEKDGKKWS